VLVEALHQHLRDQGNHDVTIHLPGSEFRGTLSGMGKKKEEPRDTLGFLKKSEEEKKRKEEERKVAAS
jgi:hypothetical protein